MRLRRLIPIVRRVCTIPPALARSVLEAASTNGADLGAGVHMTFMGPARGPNRNPEGD